MLRDPFVVDLGNRLTDLIDGTDDGVFGNSAPRVSRIPVILSSRQSNLSEPSIPSEAESNRTKLVGTTDTNLHYGG